MEIKQEKYSRTEKIGLATAVFVLLYLLFLLYTFANDTANFFYSRMLVFPAIAAFAAIITTQTGLLRRWDMRILTAYTLWTVVVSLISHKSVNVGYEQTHYFVAGFALVCYPLAFLLPQTSRRRIFNGILHVFLAVLVVVSVVAIVTVIRQTRILTGVSGVYIGLDLSFYNRLKIFVHPNMTAGVIMLALLLSVYMVLSYRHVAVKVYYVLCALVFYVVIGLTDSRTTMMALCGAAAMLGFLVVWRKMRSKSVVTTAVVGLLVGVVAAAVFYVGFIPAVQGVEWTAARVAGTPQAPRVELFQAHLQKELPAWLSPVAQAEEEGEPEVVITERKDRNLGTFTGRTQIWGDAFALIRENPMILLRGNTDMHMDEITSGISWYVTTLHNSYLQVLVALGIPGLLLLAAFLVLLVIKAVRVFFDRSGQVLFGDQFLPVLLAACMVVALFEAFYFVKELGVYSPVFFLVAGWVTSIFDCRRRI